MRWLWIALACCLGASLAWPLSCYLVQSRKAPAVTEFPCPACSGTRRASQYLCRADWFSLPVAAQRALKRRDRQARARLQELYEQITAGVPLDQIHITP
ncbi:hypothetical protein [Streptomyces sp. NBC_01262]|uniref:hypothetical protein n=1 Tax=Streptomyces sp. NBC_01262 TaxID=2903803 RepID=UPI002E37DD39|nr:hypothetical protein [Streptomyces sp. NBC_01262]